MIDGQPDEVVRMPSESPWPVTLALVTAVFFAMLLTSHWIAAGIFAIVALLVLAAWHAHEPEPEVV